MRAHVKWLASERRYGVWTPFEYKDDIKAIPTARWDSFLRCWTVDESYVGDAQRLCRKINGENGHVETPEGFEELEGALKDFFEALPVNLRKATHRALAGVFHPDKGGNTEVMKVLNIVRHNKEP